jgi:hypothetical protein
LIQQVNHTTLLYVDRSAALLAVQNTLVKLVRWTTLVACLDMMLTYIRQISTQAVAVGLQAQPMACMPQGITQLQRTANLQFSAQG